MPHSAALVTLFFVFVELQYTQNMWKWEDSGQELIIFGFNTAFFTAEGLPIAFLKDLLPYGIQESISTH